MWYLVSLSLIYHRKALLVTWVIALLLPKPGLVILAIVAIFLLSAEDKERRLLLYLPLPVTRIQVGWARVVFPAMSLVLVTVATLPRSVLVGGGVEQAANAARELLFFAIGLMFILQLVLTMDEIQSWGSGRRMGALRGGAILLVLLSISFVVLIALATSGSYWVAALGSAALILGLMGFTVFLFQRRPSFTSG